MMIVHQVFPGASLDQCVERLASYGSLTWKQKTLERQWNVRVVGRNERKAHTPLRFIPSTLNFPRFPLPLERFSAPCKSALTRRGKTPEINNRVSISNKLYEPIFNFITPKKELT